VSASRVLTSSRTQKIVIFHGRDKNVKNIPIRKEIVYLGSAPSEEEPAQLGSPGFEELARQECRAYIGQLRRYIEAKGLRVPEGFQLRVQPQPHDFGDYYEVIALFDGGCKESWELAILLEGESPENWDQIARKELGLLECSKGDESMYVGCDT